jgi:hypothetical protein
MRAGLQVWTALLAALTGCGNWPYGDPTVPAGSGGLLEPEAEVEEPAPNGPACTQTRTPVALDAETEVGTAADVVHWVEGFHTGALIWSSTGNRTTITIDVWDVRAFFVKSQISAGHIVNNSDASCATYLELVAQVELASGDGRIFYDTELTLRTYGAVEAFGMTYLAQDVVGAQYAPLVSGRCFQGLQLKLLLGDSGFSGSFSNDFTQGGCDVSSDVHVSAPAAHWGPRWQSY